MFKKSKTKDSQSLIFTNDLRFVMGLAPRTVFHFKIGHREGHNSRVFVHIEGVFGEALESELRKAIET